MITLLHHVQAQWGGCNQLLPQLKIPARSLPPPPSLSPCIPTGHPGSVLLLALGTQGWLLQHMVGHEPDIAASHVESSCPIRGVSPGGIPICLHI